MNRLVTDVGNTTTKVAVFEKSEIVHQSTARLTLPFIESIIRDHQPGASIFSSVADVDEKVIACIRSLPQSILLDHRTPLPYRNRYSTPATLGHDRMGNAAGAQMLFPGRHALVMDAGTCFKFDFMHANGEYLGGAISPGLTMRYRAVNRYTGQLPLLEPVDDAALIGDSTAASIHSGIFNGMIAEINGIINRYEDAFPDVQLIMTGGDAHYFLNHLKKSIFATPDLTLKGLLTILQYNYPDDP